MSGSTIGGVVGAVVGSFIPGVGTQLGWMIGSAIGGYVDPEQISQFGPRLSDASQQTARDGVPIPYGYGTFPCHGNIIWCSEIAEHVNESTDDGKGSGVETTTTTYTYTRSYAIGICQGEIAGLLQIKRNGKTVWDTRTDEEFEFIYNPDGVSGMFDVVRQYIAQARAFTGRFSQKLAIYTGSNTQTADPTMEAYLGVGEVTAYRGLAYIVVTDDDVTELRGAVPQYEFVVATSGTSTESEENPAWVMTDGLGISYTADGTDWDVPLEIMDTDGDKLLSGGGLLLKYDPTTGIYSEDDGETWSDEIADMGSAHPGAYIAGRFWLVAAGGVKYSVNARTWTTIPITMFGTASAVGGTSSILVVGDNAGYVRVSDDGGATFGALVNLFGSSYVTAIATNGTRVVAASSAGEFAYTDNGIDWFAGTTPYTPPGNNDGGVARIAYGNGIWVAVSTNIDGGQTVYSVNGSSWSFATGTSGHSGHDVAYGGGLFVSVGANWTTLTSTDGNNWTSRDNNFDSRAAITSVAALACGGLELPDAPGWYVDHQGNLCGPVGEQLTRDTVLLSTIVAAEFQRVGLTSDDYDVSQLTDEVLGYRVLPNGSGVDASLGPLMQAYFFDVAEWDGKLRCIKRGGASSLSLTMDDLAERDGDAIEWTRVQEAELLRTVTVGYIDPAAGYTPTTQKWERRAGTVQAKGEAAVEIAITATADTAASIAKKRGLIAWAETEKALLSLPYRRAAITPTDINTITDASGEVHRLRVGQVEDDSGVRLLEVTKERGNVYDATATGATPTIPNLPTGGGLFGPSILLAMNLPRLRSVDNVPGAYVAVTGLLPGWQGADIYVSADGGVSEQFALRIMSRATMGQLVSTIDADDEPITVRLYDNRALSTITADQLAARQNAFAITSGTVSEVGQFLTATENADDDWELTDTVRGLLGTTAASHLGGDAFVMLDQSVFFMPLDISLAGKTLILRAVSIGTANDENETISFIFDPQFTGPQETEFYTDANGEKYTNADGEFYYKD